MAKKQKRKQRQQRTRVDKPRVKVEDRACCVCNRVMWGESVPLGFGKERHASCAPGSVPWRERYERLPKALRTEVMRFIYEQGVT